MDEPATALRLEPNAGLLLATHWPETCPGLDSEAAGRTDNTPHQEPISKSGKGFRNL